MADAIDWTEDLTWTPTDDELEQECRFWADLDRIAEYDAWAEVRAELESFEDWPLEDLADELELARVLTPDRADIIAELEAEIERRGVAA